MDFSIFKQLEINNQPVIKLQVGSITIWEKEDENWNLDENGYIIGTDGKYYQRLYKYGEEIEYKPDIDLNNQWVIDTVSGDLDVDTNFDYYMSNSNYHVNNSYAQMQIKWTGLTNISFLYRSKAESTYDYLIINGLDKPKFSSQPSANTPGILAYTRGNQSNIYTTLNIECDESEHFIWICYIKDTSAHTEPDRAFFGVPNNLITHEIITKKGSELRYEYIKSTDTVIYDDTHIQFKYYKTYFTPNNLNQFKTDEYILGEPVIPTPITRNYLRFEATTNPVDISINNESAFTNLQYSYGFEEIWLEYENPIHLNIGDIVYFKGTGMANTGSPRGFITSDKVECHGNIMSLRSNDFENITSTGQYTFNYLFRNTKITTAPELPATSLGYCCYQYMFENCTLLVDAPELPATTIVDNAYYYMFNGCTSLVNAPKRLGTRIQKNGCTSMFKGCTSLVNAPELPATSMYFTGYCYVNMFKDCTSLVNAPELPATSLSEYCYDGMFKGCTSLVNAPELPATTVPTGGYRSMFENCSSLKYIKVGATSWSTYSGPKWVTGVPSGGTFVKPAATEIPTGEDGIPSGWTVENV